MPTTSTAATMLTTASTLAAICSCHPTDLVYGTSCFRFHTDTLSWNQAFDQCMNEAPPGSTGRLAWLNSWTLYQQIIQCLLPGVFPGDFWFGLKKSCGGCIYNRSRTYWWSNTTFASVAITWGLDNETVGTLIENESTPCVRIRIPMEWNDRDCALDYQYLCEYGKTHTTLTEKIKQGIIFLPTYQKF